VSVRVWWPSGVVAPGGCRAPGLIRRAEYRRLRILSLHQQRRVTTEAIIGGVIGTVDDPRMLLLGRLDDRGRLRYVARTVPLTLSQQQETGPMLTAADDAQPRPQPLPAAWSGQLDRPDPQPYVEVTRRAQPTA
jgi:hypothetical protein